MAKSALQSDDSAVTPVVGTLLIMGITVAGIVSILFWGTPTIQAIQDQNSLVAMTGEFEDLRLLTYDLTIPDASRVPRITMDDGALALEAGTRIAVHAVHEYAAGAQDGCLFHVTGWEAGSATTELNIDVSGCTGTTWQTKVSRVTGSNVVLKATGGTGTVTIPDTTLDVTTGDWLVQLFDTAAAKPDFVVAEAWIIDSDQLSWSLASSVSDLRLVLEGGAIFQEDGGSVFLMRDPRLHEDQFASGDYVVWFPTYNAAAYSEVSGRATTTAFMGLLGHHLRISSQDVVLLRYDFHDGMAEAWCNSLLVRSPDTGAYSEDASYDCDSGDAAGIRSVTYTVPTVPGPGQDAFPFELFHDRIHVFLQS